MPTVSNVREISLFGVRYPLAETWVARDLLNQIVPVINVGDSDGAPREEEASKWNFTTTGGGLGRYRYHMGRGDAPDKFFDSSLRTDTGEITLLPLATSLVDLGATPVDIIDWGSATYFVGGTAIRRFDGTNVQFYCTNHNAWETGSPSGPHPARAIGGTAVSCSIYNGRLVVWYTSGYTHYDGATTWADVATAGTHGLVFDGQLVAVDATGQIKKATDITTPTWTNVARIYDETPTAIFVYVDGNGDPQPHVATVKGLHLVKFVDSKVLPLQVRFSDSHADNGRGSGIWNTELMIPKGGSVRKYVASNRFAQVTEIGPNTGDGMPQAKVGRVVDLELTMEHMMLAAVDAGASGTSGVYMWRGSGWHTLVEASTSGASIRCVGFSNLTTVPRLYFSEGTAIWYIPWYDTSSNPIQTPTAGPFRATGYLVTPWFGAAEIRNLAVDIRALCRAITSVETISFDAAYNDDDREAAWNAIGSVTRNSINSITFPNKAQPFRTIRIRVTLNRGSTNTLTPRLSPGILRWTPQPRALYGYAFKVDVTRNYGGKTPSELQEALEDAGQAGVGTFSYRPSDDRTVRIKTMRDLSQTGADQRGRYQVAVAELIPEVEADPTFNWSGECTWDGGYAWG